ncbi:MAG: hypothetical protein U0L47_08450 [Paludibacteraceae bacterium]|nr:hypothetical protein [Paludibacteraceae bacterium]
MSNKHNHIQDYATPTEASKDRREWEDSSYQSFKSGNDYCSTRQDEDKRDGGSHIHYIINEDDGRTVKSDSSGKTDIVQQTYWPDKE